MNDSMTKHPHGHRGELVPKPDEDPNTERMATTKESMAAPAVGW